jgi:hypothetical protein
VFDKYGQVHESLAFLRKENGELRKDADDKYIYIHTNNSETKTIEIIDRKISLK